MIYNRALGKSYLETRTTEESKQLLDNIDNVERREEISKLVNCLNNPETISKLTKLLK
ncbi:MAG TPA: hypothetical protein VMC80_02340 [Patescibacteria group bacterium]|nr:hypothetical protein [Patescibacteria group bacterium]